jgi:Macrocin-O-methyltransferase (TylF)
MRNAVAIFLRQFAEDARTTLAKIVRRLIRKIFEIIVSDIDIAAAFGDPNGAAAFEEKHLRDVPKLKSRADLLAYAVNESKIPDGLYLEFGVYKGASINRLASLRPLVTFYGFDSFCGLPETWTMGALKGAFTLNGKLPPVRSNVELIAGYFETTLPPFIAAHRGRSIAFMHIDCDLYSSTKHVLFSLRDLIADGTIILFDEFFNFPNWQRGGEYQAFVEFVQAAGLHYEFIGYIRHSVQMAVRIKVP